jgi:hypothetical protein
MADNTATNGTQNPSEQSEQELSLRDELDAAFEQEADDETGDAGEGGEAAPAEDGRARDEKGRFAPSKATDEPGKAPGGAQAAAQQQQPGQGQGQPAAGSPAPAPGGELKAPASWTPQAREKWAGVDPEVRAEVHRRELEMQRVLHQGAQHRQFIDAFEQVVRPYEMFIRQENSSPLQAVENLMRTAAELRVGTPMSKAQLVGGLIRQFGVDVQMLDSILAGTVPQGGQQQQEFRDPRFDQFLAQQQQLLAQQQQAEDAQMRQQLAAFGETHEFYRDVAGIMADLVEIRTRQGQGVDIEKIYEQACKMHEGVSTILAQRAAAQKTSSNSAAVLRAKRAAASVKGDTTLEAGATVPKNDSIRAALEAAFEEAGRT